MFITEYYDYKLINEYDYKNIIIFPHLHTTQGIRRRRKTVKM